ncbi:MAG: hypothetical protein IPL95_08530 [Saprospiraceae bacterium]|nr:hypothetical protein [Saprospiraceae bacterium]
MNKTIKYATNGALIFGIGNALLNSFKQLNNQEKTNSFNWSELLRAFGKGALLGGAGGLAIGAIKDNDMTNILMATGGTAGFVKEALNNYTDNDLSLPKKAEKIQKKLYDEFNESLTEYPSINGSIIKGTAIQNSDIDIQLKFNKDADSIENIRNNVEYYLKDSFYDRNLIKVRSQNHSVGLVFDLKGEEKRIDIVPMREIENGKGDTYLYSTKNYSIKKTNTQKQISKLKFTEKQKQIIKLLKGWKIANDLNLPSVFIEHLVLRAFVNNSVPHGLDNALLFIIEYIANNITRIKIVDPGNTNNIISECLTIDEKEKLQNFCFSMLDEIVIDKKNIVDYFSIKV